MINVANKTELKSYLVEKGLASEDEVVSFQLLGGGVSGNVVKVATRGQTIVIKQALPKLKVKENWFSDIERIFTEEACLRTLHLFIPETVPDVLFVDRDHYLFGMEAAPENSQTWKEQLLSGDVNFNIGEKVIRTLLAIHNMTHDNRKIREKFQDRNVFIQLRIDPYLRTVARRHPKLQKSIDAEINRLLETHCVLVHGDFSPKNVLVNEEQHNMYILDFEVAHYGDPTFDVAFFINHLILKAVKNKIWSVSYMNLLVFLTQRYFNEMKHGNPKEIERHTTQLLAYLLLARVDGKSPAEYIQLAKDKQLIRKLSYTIVNDHLETVEEVKQLVNHEISFGG